MSRMKAGTGKKGRLEIRPIMNSPMEEILEFRSCCNVRAFDQNLEIHITNKTDQTIGVHSHFDLKGEQGSKRIETLMPHGEQRMAQGQTIAFYCTMDEKQWGAANKLVIYDTQGNPYPVDLNEVPIRTSRERK